jgi:small subunit ribosomal protein S4
MARYNGPVCRLCRREGVKLYLKGTRCESPKCSIVKREQPPGMHVWRRGKTSKYGLQLREKQKLKRSYGIMERQFRRIFEIATRTRGNTGEALLTLVERRLDNVVYSLGLAVSRPQARQLIRHGHVRVDGVKVDIPSYFVQEGHVIKTSGKEKVKKLVEENIEIAKSRGVPEWLELDSEKQTGTVVRLPRRDEIAAEFQEQLIVELLSK